MQPLKRSYPGLVSENVQLLEPDVLDRPDISSFDCIPRSIEIEQKVHDDFQTVFGIDNSMKLEEWITVCCVPFRFLPDQVC